MPIELLIFLAVMLVVSSLISAMLMRAAVSIFNKLVRSDAPLREPRFGEAFGISVGAFLLGALAGFVLRGFLQTKGQVGANFLLLMYASVPFNIVVLGVLLTLILPTRPWKGLSVATIQMALLYAISAFFTAIYMLLIR